MTAPFTQEMVDSFNAFQESGCFHPFTCGGNRTDEKHLDGEGRLEATLAGLRCPYCDYKQNWAWAWMLDWSWSRQS